MDSLRNAFRRSGPSAFSDVKRANQAELEKWLAGDNEGRKETHGLLMQAVHEGRTHAAVNYAGSLPDLRGITIVNTHDKSQLALARTPPVARNAEKLSLSSASAPVHALPSRPHLVREPATASLHDEASDDLHLLSVKKSALATYEREHPVDVVSLETFLAAWQSIVLNNPDSPGPTGADLSDAARKILADRQEIASLEKTVAARDQMRKMDLALGVR